MMIFLKITNYILILACPKVKMTMENGSSLKLNYSFTTKETLIPFMVNFYQEILFILAPKSEFKPNIDPVENSHALQGLAKSSIGWEQHEFNLTKHISLRIDSTYLAILRVYGRTIENSESPNHRVSYLTLDCPQKFGSDTRLFTKTWQCLNGDMIHAESVCDSEIHCADSSDEAPLLCKGGQSSFLDGLKYFLTTILFLGFASYLCSLVLSSMTFITLENPDSSKEIDVSLEIKESFKAMAKACSTIDIHIENKDGLNTTDILCTENIDPLKTVYRQYHNQGPVHQKIFFETIHDFSMNPSYEEPCTTLVDAIAKEEEDIHKNDQKRPNCVETFLRMNMEIASYYFDVFERNGFFSRLKQEIICIPKSIFGKKYPDAVFSASILTTISLAIKNIVAHYLDVAFDMNVFSALQHVANNFIGDTEKFVRLSSLPIHEISYAYLLFGLFSHLSHYIIFAIDFKNIFKMKDSRMRKFLFAV